MDKTHLLLKLVHLFSQKSLSSTPCKNTNLPVFSGLSGLGRSLAAVRLLVYDTMSVSLFLQPHLHRHPGLEREADHLLSGVQFRLSESGCMGDGQLCMTGF